ncbi:tryptophan--tRNA ligase [Thalassobacillus pellis]|uniref:tryptophan--tRNA ligase n=1 Tax=Thalassobacillus pellis TaxID=748008 RepID=UPI001961D97A|nr:tryptophan--tRNA ligase [Thalassobacillus pellis]MBM7554345.1 tryptophanyl-tRNA synthetase [Thalassobacillus pellis]
MKRRTITGVKPTGTPHIGNYIGAIKPAIDLSKNNSRECFYFIADLHALNSIYKRAELKQLTYEVAATWLALGLDTEESLFYRQSDIPELVQLQWVLSAATSKGLMNRAHAYKAKVAENQADGKEEDDGVNMGLFNYPIMMAADILMFQSDDVPVGKDNIQHIEMARDIAQSFNRNYGYTFKLPEAVIAEDTAVIPGTDGRKMSKSYGNTIPIFTEEKELEKRIKRIRTDSTAPDEPKDTKGSTLFELYRAFATKVETKQMSEAFASGIGYGTVKQELFMVMNRELSGPRKEFHTLLKDKVIIDRLLTKGKEKVQPVANLMMEEVYRKIGLT